MSDGLTLSSLLGGHVAVEWYEAVALVREVSERVIDDAGPSVPIPELNQIHLSPEGRIDVDGGVPTDEPVRRLGQLLLALVVTSEIPVQLRLVISQATAPSPPYGSIREYSDALGFFERPDRSGVLQALAARAAASTLPVSDQPTLDSIAPLPSAASIAQKPKKRPSSRARAGMGRFAVAAVVVVSLCAGGAWYAWNRGIGPRNRSEASAMADSASDKVGSVLIAGASAVTERLGLGRVVPGDSVAPAASIELPAAPPKPRPRRPAGAVPSIEDLTSLRAFDLEPVVAIEGGALPAETPSIERSTVERRVVDPTIYSLGADGVTPPVGVRPQLARELPPDLNRDHLGRIELVVASDGTVESAKLLGPPRTVHDSLILSVVKAWNFQPALKDGFPVRYKKTIWIESP